jgi:hypothetical protein
MDFTASDTAKLINISVCSINTIYIKLRKKLLPNAKKFPPFNGIIELDESYFGSRCVRGMSSTAAQGGSGKTIVFGLLKRDGNVLQKLYLTTPKPRRRALSAVY